MRRIEKYTEVFPGGLKPGRERLAVGESQIECWLGLSGRWDGKRNQFGGDTAKDAAAARWTAGSG